MPMSRRLWNDWCHDSDWSRIIGAACSMERWVLRRVGNDGQDSEYAILSVTGSR